ncbi:MAG: hypothetical protein IPH32_13835 [Bacteroidetes bacterium]|nr:hypothetical protein [Bacteroidota bacterium]
MRKKDRQNNYWFSSPNEGVFMAPNLNNIVSAQQNLLPNKIVAAKQGFLIATKKGEICLYDSLLNFKSILNKQIDNSEIYYLNFDSTSNDLFYSSKGFTQAPQLNFQNCNIFQTAIKEITRLDGAYYAIAASGYCGLATFNNEKENTSLWNNYFTNHIKVEVPNTSSILEGVRGKSVAYNKQKKPFILPPILDCLNALLHQLKK